MSDFPIVARYVFHADRAHEFTEDGRTVVEMGADSIQEVMHYSEEFADALEDVVVLLEGQVVVLSDYKETL